MTTKIINLPYLAGTDKIPTDYIKRDAILNQIEKGLDIYDILLLEGDEGIGKTTILNDFILNHSLSCISYSVNEFDKYTYSFDSILEKIYNQIYFYCNNVETDSIPDLTLYNSIQGRLRKKIKQFRKPLIFVFDGLELLSNSEIERLLPLFEILPWKKAKFIFSGKKEKLSIIFNLKLNISSISVINFGFHESKEYLKDISTDEELLQELHKLSSKGIPSKLKELKFLCKTHGGAESFLSSNNLTEKTDYLEKIWCEIDPNDELLNKILAVVAFSDIELELQAICEILDIKLLKLQEKIENITFIGTSSNKITFEMESIRKFSKFKLNHFEEIINAQLIDFYEKNQASDTSIFNLPHLYNKAKLWEKLTTFLNTDTFIHLLDKHKTIVNLHSQFSLAFDASKKTNLKFDEARLKFALHKSSVKELQKHELCESEIEALIVLNQYTQALSLANSALLKEDRLKLLTIVAKQRKINNLLDDPDLIEQIKSLYEQIDFTSIKEKGFEIASLLIYTNLQLAIELVEKVTDNNSVNNSLDYAFAYLTLFATEANKKNKTQIADIDVINSKIENKDVKNITKALRFLSDEYVISDLINSVNNISKFSQKLFILKNWIKNNSEDDDIYKAIKFTLEEIVRTSSENVPNANSLYEIAIPLPKIKDKKEIEDLILLFDAHKNTIDRPTKSYIQLQLTIAEALLKIDYEKAKDRIFDIYLLIDELTDLSIKTDCLSFLWIWLAKNDLSNEIENSISSYETIEVQTKKNIDLLLKDTAYHFKMIENIISTIMISNSDFIFEIIKKLNTEVRRDTAYCLALETYIDKTNINDFDFLVINKFNREIKNPSLLEDIIILIIDKFYFEKENVLPYITKITPYYPMLTNLTKVGNKCYIICHAIKILNFDKETYNLKIDELLIDLRKSWDSIDILWEKIEIGFLIARDLSDFSFEKAKEYLDYSTTLKQEEAFSSNSIITTYIKSIKLSIKSICGISLFKSDIEKELNLLYNTIDVLQSTGEKLKLWSALYLKLRALNKANISNNIFKTYINPLLSQWSSNSEDSYKVKTIIYIAPTLYTYNSTTFFSDYLEKMKADEKDQSIKNIFSYILTNLNPDDPTSNNQQLFEKLDYSSINELTILLEKLDNDYMIFKHITYIIDTIRNNTNLNNTQRDSIKSKIKKIINDKLPSPNGIQHEGYNIVSEAELLSLETYTESNWKSLIDRANLIDNLSDRSFILILIADKITIKSNKKPIEIMEKAFELIKTIPSIYDKTNRFDASWDIWLNIDKSGGKFKKHLKLALEDLLITKDGEIAGIKNLIDMAQQHNTELAEELITMLDQDPARKKLKEPLIARLQSKNKIDKACKQPKLLNDLSCSQFQEVFHKNLLDLNDGKKSSKDITETYEILEKASNHSLDDSFDSYVYFIQNAIKRYEINNKEKDILNSIFSATIENTKLIVILSSNNIQKMKNLYNHKSKSENNPIISPGERNKAISIFQKWFKENIKDQLIIIDPYFTENELNLLKLIQETKPECSVKILTSKTKSRNNNHINEETKKSINKDIYIQEWKNISSDEPLDTQIKIVWDKDTLDTPFHDRWFLEPSVRKGLKLGTSYNGFGNKESGIEELNEDSIINVEDIINKYLYREETKVGPYLLKYESFDLEE
ncbi:hypothetical protein [Flavobacterium sp. KBS0721]|uniref:hypothetical protein n=1 Tax=Flavobacterium sp. KBS0721 TaxID=1179672 RepID=UPI00098F7534|nr:hypothetical protein [Flavobacterium sp. KBS0721]QDW22360.1 hypothetical protein B0M43_0020280 [Flavobacterium sp. KBS0721]